jgi:hypothetical protein
MTSEGGFSQQPMASDDDLHDRSEDAVVVGLDQERDGLVRRLVG